MRAIAAECVAGMRINFDCSGEFKSGSLEANSLAPGSRANLKYC